MKVVKNFCKKKVIGLELLLVLLVLVFPLGNVSAQPIGQDALAGTITFQVSNVPGLEGMKKKFTAQIDSRCCVDDNYGGTECLSNFISLKVSGVEFVPACDILVMSYGADCLPLEVLILCNGYRSMAELELEEAEIIDPAPQIR